MRRWIAVALTALAAPALAESPLGAGAPVAGPRTLVANLASVHLSGFEEWTPAMLEPLLDRLVAFRPEVITQEGVSGEQCHAMRQFPDRYAEAVATYCWNPDEILGATRMSVPEALRAVRETLAEWPAEPTAAQRRRLSMLFLAAGDKASARVQWLRLPEAERHAGDGLDDEMIALVERKGKPMNESFDVAAVLAARLGLDRVYAVDDHTSDAALARAGKPFEEALTAHFEECRKNPLHADGERRSARVHDGVGLLAFYREFNRPGAMDAQVRMDFGGALAQERPGTPARAYVGWWETRNLRMVANIRERFVDRPGTRVLNIVGSSHKPWYDALMGMMADVTVVDTSALLGD